LKIYTRRGDGGETDLFGGPRVGKDDARVEAYGEVDELNAAIGVAAAASPHEDVRALLGYDGQQAQTLSRGGFGAEELVLKLMEQPKRYRDPDVP